ncbi:MAG TPA: hypothetical protein VJ508_06450, partial [Saprospiraceae bacterium]|nr:hypothetical protein [Saprospiraceae bacterium]
MIIRKLLLLSLLTISSIVSLVAQNLVHVHGTVADLNGQGVDSVNIQIYAFWADSSAYQASIYTNPDGTYEDYFPGPNDPNVLGFIQVVMVDCNNTLQSLYYTSANGATDFEANFTYCANIVTDSCEVYIIRESNPGALDILTAWTPPNQTATYLWSTGETTQSISPTQNGLYCVTATLSPLDCTVSDCYQFNFDSSGFCFAYIVATDNNNGGYNLTAYGTGVAPFTYAWGNGETSQSIYNVPPGTYCCVVTDSTGCLYSTCTIIQDPNFCEAYIERDPNGGLTAYGYGLPPVSYLWSTGDTTQTIYPQQQGLYCVTVTDANN